MIKRIIKTIHSYTKNFTFINENYKNSFLYIFQSWKKHKRLNNEIQNYFDTLSSPVLKREVKEFLFHLRSGKNFYDAWYHAFEDPLLKLIIKTESFSILTDYINRKYEFWRSYINTNTYAYIILACTIFASKFMMKLFNIPFNAPIILFITIMLLLHIIIYFLIIGLVGNTYKTHIRNHMYLQYLNQNCSLNTLVERYNMNLCTITHMIRKHKNLYTFQNESTEFLNRRWRIIHYVAHLCIL